MHYGAFSSIPGLSPLAASRFLTPVVIINNVFRHCQVSPGGAQSPLVETTDVEDLVK